MKQNLPEIDISDLQTLVSTVKKPSAVAKSPTVVELPVVAETPVVAEPSVAVKPPAVAEPPVVAEMPTVKKPPIVAEVQATVKTPSVAKTPVVAEPPAIAKLPVVAETPAVAEPPAVAKPAITAKSPKIAKSAVVAEPPLVAEPPAIAEPPVVVKPPAVVRKPGKAVSLSKRDAAIAHLFQERCRQLNISTFFQENSPVRSLGFTSAIDGEGKSFLAMVTANLLANDSNVPVTLVECNWEHPSIHKYYNIPASPGAAEWIRKECNIEDVRHRVERNLTVVPAGNGSKDAVRLLAQVRQQGLLQLFAPRNDLLVVDLPSIATTAYGQVAASLLDTVVMVVHAGVTPDALVEEACSKLKNVPVQGIILNQIQSKIPRWLRQIL